MLWTPLLEGTLADAAAQAARDIVLAVASQPARDATSADRTVFWAYASHAFDEPFANACYDAALADLVIELRAGVPYPALHGGLAGLGWALGHVIDGDAEHALAVIDEALVAVLSVEHWRGPSDLISGLVGYGVYFLERLAHAPDAALAREGLERVVAHLARRATRSDAGASWLSPCELLPAHYHAEWPDGHYDCGLAHGVPGVIAFLDRAARIADPPAGARALCDDAVRWLLAQRATDGFPAMVYPGRPRARARTAWCYGDPGVAAALWHAAPALARELALAAVTRDPATCGVKDSGLCHGSIGLAHLCNRFYQASGDRTLAVAARRWFAHGLGSRRPEGIAGFPAWRGDSESYQPIQNVLEGAMGVALSLLAAIGPDEPCWDRTLLCDLGGS